MRWMTGVAHDRPVANLHETRNQVPAMNDNASSEATSTALRVRQILLGLARREDDLAHAEAAAVPYWAPRPVSVIGHHAAASALRSEADRLLEAS